MRRYEGRRSGSTGTNSYVLVVGNFNQWRNAEGLLSVAQEIVAQGAESEVRIRLISDRGIHPSLLPFLNSSFLDYRMPGGSLEEGYLHAWGALVPALRVTGMKTTILQAWSYGCPVICSAASASTVDYPSAVAIGRDARAMVQLLRTLNGDRDRKDRLVNAGFNALETTFNPDHQDAQIRQLVSDVAQSKGVTQHGFDS